MRKKLLECLKNSNQRVDTNKSIAFFGAIVGAIVLIILALKGYANIEILFTAFLVATLGQLPSKGLNDLGKLKLEKSSPPYKFEVNGELSEPQKEELNRSSRGLPPQKPISVSKPYAEY